MRVVHRASERGPSGARERLLVGCLAVLALLSLPVSLSVGLHHADHHGVWIAGEPESTQVAACDSGASNDLVCTLCLATGSSGNASLRPTAGVAVPASSADPTACSLVGRLPQRVDVAVAGPRAPPQA